MSSWFLSDWRWNVTSPGFSAETHQKFSPTPSFLLTLKPLGLYMSQRSAQTNDIKAGLWGWSLWLCPGGPKAQQRLIVMTQRCGNPAEVWGRRSMRVEELLWPMMSFIVMGTCKCWLYSAVAIGFRIIKALCKWSFIDETVNIWALSKINISFFRIWKKWRLSLTISRKYIWWGNLCQIKLKWWQLC